MTLWRSPAPGIATGGGNPHLTLTLYIDLVAQSDYPKGLDAEPVQLGHKVAAVSTQAVLHKAVFAPPTLSGLLKNLVVCHSEELSWAYRPPKRMKTILIVTRAKAGAHFRSGTQWIPAYAGMTRFSGELPWAFGPPEEMKVRAILSAAKDLEFRSEAN